MKKLITELDEIGTWGSGRGRGHGDEGLIWNSEDKILGMGEEYLIISMTMYNERVEGVK